MQWRNQGNVYELTANIQKLEVGHEGIQNIR